MRLTDDQIEQFRTLYLKRFGKEISKDEAYEQASKLIQLVMFIYKPMSLQRYEAMQKRRLETLPEVLEDLALHETENQV